MILVASAIPGANEALAAGQEARVATYRAGYMRGELARRCARPLPLTDRERGWALANRRSYRAECEHAENDAAYLMGGYGFLLADLRDDAPATAEAVDAAVWRTEK